MTNLTLANQELFRRTPDECFPSLEALYAHCAQQRASSEDHWERPQDVTLSGEMQLNIGDSQQGKGLNDWSFTQLCRMAGVSKDTINRLSYSTASRALQETLFEVLSTGDDHEAVRSTCESEQPGAGEGRLLP